MKKLVGPRFEVVPALNLVMTDVPEEVQSDLYGLLAHAAKVEGHEVFTDGRLTRLSGVLLPAVWPLEERALDTAVEFLLARGIAGPDWAAPVGMSTPNDIPITAACVEPFELEWDSDRTPWFKWRGKTWSVTDALARALEELNDTRVRLRALLPADPAGSLEIVNVVGSTISMRGAETSLALLATELSSILTAMPSDNYVTMSVHVPTMGRVDLIVVRVGRGGKGPHQIRAEAETALETAKDDLFSANRALDALTIEVNQAGDALRTERSKLQDVEVLLDEEKTHYAAVEHKLKTLRSAVESYISGSSGIMGGDAILAAIEASK